MADLRHRVASLTPGQRSRLAERLREKMSRQHLRAFVTVTPNASVTGEELTQHLRELVPAHAVPSTIEILPALPTLPNGKIDRRALSSREAVEESAGDLTAPTSDAESSLLKIWQDVLGTDAISIDDDFFEIGGDSILSIQVISRARAAGLQIAPQDFADNPSIAQLAALDGVQPDPSPAPTTPTSTSPNEANNRAPADESVTYNYLVPIQTKGTRLPLFCMHSGGDAMLYQGLSRQLGPEFPLYGLQAIGLADDEPPADSIEEVAIEYLKEIRGIQRTGPYQLLGNCFGAAVGLEIAHRLLADGEEIAVLIVVDAAAPVYTEPAKLQSIWDALGKRDASRSVQLLKRNIKAPFTRSALAIRARRLYVERFGSPAQKAGERFRQIYQAFLQAFYKYEREEYHGRVLFYQGSDSPSWGRNLVEDWKELAPNLEVETFDCTHREFLDEPHVQMIANHLANNLR